MKVTTRRDEIILGQAQKSAINGLNSTAVQATLQTGFVYYDVTVVQTSHEKRKVCDSSERRANKKLNIKDIALGRIKMKTSEVHKCFRVRG